MNAELEELYQQVILDHSRRPRNKGQIADGIRVHGDNPSCGDEIDLSVKLVRMAGSKTSNSLGRAARSARRARP
jgi:NifU-like protein involved in Fe-S cluster formation